MDFCSFWRVHWQARESVCEKTFSIHLHSLLFFRPCQEVCTRRCQSQSSPAKLCSSLKTANARKTPDMLICTTVPAVVWDFEPRQIKFGAKVLFFHIWLKFWISNELSWTKTTECVVTARTSTTRGWNQQRAAVSCLWWLWIRYGNALNPQSFLCSNIFQESTEEKDKTRTTRVFVWTGRDLQNSG